MEYIKHLFYISAVATAFFLGYYLKTGDDAAVLPASQTAAVSNHAAESANSSYSGKFVRQSTVQQTELVEPAASANAEKDIAAESERSQKRKNKNQAVSLEEREEYLKKMGEEIIERQRLQSEADERQKHDNGQEEILLTQHGEIPEEDREDVGMIEFPEQQAVPATRDFNEEKDNLFKKLKESGMAEEDAKQTAEEMFAHEAASEKAEQKKNEKEESAYLSQFLNSLPDADDMEELSDEERARIGESIWEQQQ